MNAEFYLLTFKIRIQVSTICCAKTQESICLKSSRGQLLMWTSGPLFSEEKMADYNVESFSSSGSAMRLAVSTFGLAQQLFCFIQFFSSVSAASRIGIPSDLFPNLNIPMKHRQIGGQSARFTLHKRFSIAIRCLLLRQKKIVWFQQSMDFSLASGSTDVCQVSAGPTRASRLDPLLDCSLWAPTTDLTYTCQSIF